MSTVPPELIYTLLLAATCHASDDGVVTHFQLRSVVRHSRSSNNAVRTLLVMIIHASLHGISDTVYITASMATHVIVCHKREENWPSLKFYRNSALIAVILLLICVSLY